MTRHSKSKNRLTYSGFRSISNGPPYSTSCNYPHKSKSSFSILGKRKKAERTNAKSEEAPAPSVFYTWVQIICGSA